MTDWGFGVAGAINHQLVGALAAQAENLGYDTFWANDTPGGDGLAALAAAAVTSGIRLGVGVIPIDRRSPRSIIDSVGALGLPKHRLTIGIGSGAIGHGAVKAVESAAAELSSMTEARVVVGALGPRMCDVAGRVADGALLNWMTPAYARQTGVITRAAAAGAGKLDTWIGVYVRTGLSGLGETRAIEEGRRYASYPQYAAHFARMGVDPSATTATGTAAQVRAALTEFADAANEVIVRAVAAAESIDAYADVMVAAAPGQREQR